MQQELYARRDAAPIREASQGGKPLAAQAETASTEGIRRVCLAAAISSTVKPAMELALRVLR